MTLYSAQCSESSLAVLRGLIGRTIYQIYAPCLQVAGSHFTAPSLSIPLSEQIGDTWQHSFVIFRCEWFETPKLLNDYWQLIVAHSTLPDGIEVDGNGAIVSPCTINFYSAAPVSSICVYSLNLLTQDDPVEDVLYDKALYFEFKNGKSLCIACQLNGPGIATEIHISEDAETIRSLLEETHPRLTIG